MLRATTAPNKRIVIAEGRKRLRVPAVLLLPCLLASIARAQTPATTLIQDVVYRSDGTLANGSLVISWPPFISPDGKPVFGGVKTIPMNGGVLSVSLIPTVGAIPSGTAYTVKYYQTGSVSYEEIWLVPSSVTPVNLPQVRVTSFPSQSTIVLPTQVSGIALVARPNSTQSLFAPAFAGVTPLRVVGNPAANASLLEIFDSQSTPTLRSWFDANGALATTRQIASTLPTGTPPFSVASSTKVPNLNADLLDGLDNTSFSQPGVGSNWSAPQNFKTANTIRYADQFPGANAGAKIAAAIADLPATGGTVDARGLEGPQTIAQSLDVGTSSKPVSLLLGAATLTASAKITVQSGSSVIGLGRNATTIQANPANLMTVDAIDYSTNTLANLAWSGTGITVKTFSIRAPSQTPNTSNPYPAKGNSAISFTTDGTANRSISHPLAINLSSANRIGLFFSAAKNNAGSIRFWISDGTNVSRWNIVPDAIYNNWVYAQMDLTSPDSTGGSPANLSSIVSIGFDQLEANLRYFADFIGAWNSQNEFQLLELAGDTSSARHLKLQQLTISGTSAAYLTGTHVAIDDVATANGSYGIQEAAGAQDSLIANCKIEFPGQDGIYALGSNPKITANEVTSTPRVGINVNTNLGALVEGNRVKSAGSHGIRITGTGNIVNGNRVQGADVFGIFVMNAMNSSVTGNSVDDAWETGIQLQGVSEGSTISGNTVRNTGKNAIDTTSYGVTIAGNSIAITGYSNGFPGTEAMGINVYLPSGTGGIVVSGNQIKDTGINGAGLAYGISVHAASNAIVDGNSIENPANDAILIDGASHTTLNANLIDLNNASGARAIVIDNSSATQVSSNDLLHPNSSLGASGLISIQNGSTKTSVSGNRIDLGSVSSLIGIKIASGVSSTLIGSANQFDSIGSGGAAISDSGSATKYVLNQTFATKEALSPFTTASATVSSLTEGYATVASSAAPSFDASQANIFSITLASDVTSSAISNGTAGQRITLKLCQDGTGQRAMTWPSNLKLSGGTFTLTTTPSKCDTLTAAFDGTNWYETARTINQ